MRTWWIIYIPLSKFVGKFEMIEKDLELCNFKSSGSTLPVWFYWWCQALLLTNIPTSADNMADCSMPPNNDADNGEVVWHHKTKLN